MLVYNTTYHLESEIEKNLIIWLNEVYIPEVKKNDSFKDIRLCRLLSHQEEGQAAYTLQWMVENSSELHQWHLKHGVELSEQMVAIFKDKVLGIPTLMEIME